MAPLSMRVVSEEVKRSGVAEYAKKFEQEQYAAGVGKETGSGV